MIFKLSRWNVSNMYKPGLRAGLMRYLFSSNLSHSAISGGRGKLALCDPGMITNPPSPGSTLSSVIATFSRLQEILPNLKS